MHQDAETVVGRVLSVNVAEPALLQTAKGPALSSIGKMPVTGPRRLRFLNFDGDRQADLEVHGGPDKAVYIYPHEHYAPWAAELGREPGAPGWFGENLTTSGVMESTVRLGDIWRVGSARLVISQLRWPCFKLAATMQVRGFERLFMKSGRFGWYARVLQEGLVAAGDAIEQAAVGDGPAIADAMRLKAEG